MNDAIEAMERSDRERQRLKYCAIINVDIIVRLSRLVLPLAYKLLDYGD